MHRDQSRHPAVCWNRTWTPRVSITEVDDCAQHRIEIVSKIIDALTYDTLAIALDHGTDRLVQDNGLGTLIETVENHVVAFKDDEELFHTGSSTAS